MAGPGHSGPYPALPVAGPGYLGQPDMRRLIQAALNLGWNLREQAPAPLNGHAGVDAVVVSADNELT